MKRFIATWLAAATTAAMLTPSTHALTAKNAFESSDLALLFCTYVRNNDTLRLQHKLRDLRMRLRDVYPQVRCNGASLIQFAMQNNSNDIGAFIVRSVNPSDMQEMGDMEWAEQRDMLQSTIGQTLQQRLNPTK